ncbi:MAG TPA: ABC transporter substrate-binding protein, partial [Curvibacter sp.]|nr:ABC transporter substrate-binding protein [Curvibacter sp.]
MPNTLSTLDRRTLLLAGLATGLSAWANTWPSKPLRLIVPFAPGGSSEIVARAIAGEMATTIGQNVYVENKPGAAGNIGLDAVAKAAPDGYT